MRISDWSSDVCSSDLGVEERGQLARDLVGDRPQVAGRHHDVFGERAVAVHADADGVRAQVLLAGAAVAAVAADDMALGRNPLARTEEYTSENQSLMRTQVAVLRLKNKQHTTNTNI